MHLCKSSNDNPDYYCFDNLCAFPGLVHGVFTRDGGSSDLDFRSLNVGLSVGDDKENVCLNREKIARSMGIAEHHAIYLNQVHGKEFLVLKDQILPELAGGDISVGHMLKEEPLEKEGMVKKNGVLPKVPLCARDADGIVTNIKGILAVMQVADCQAVILYDPVRQVVANIHSGWRGSLLDIVGRGVDIMTEDFGSDPVHIHAGIGPSLGPCCAEFKNYRDEIPEQFWKYKTGQYHFDFWQTSCDQLAEKGICPENIEVSRICTPCTSHIFYSYRKENITGRFAVAAGLI
ncbi:MAG: laccase domain-containing protein [Desulfamplus sp.]|nr:laccase domain-containing protein [Desulfamplus sp.]